MELNEVLDNGEVSLMDALNSFPEAYRNHWPFIAVGPVHTEETLDKLVKRGYVTVNTYFRDENHKVVGGAMRLTEEGKRVCYELMGGTERGWA